MTGGLQVRARPADGERSLFDVLQFLTDRGVSADVICLAMARAGIRVEVARSLADLVVASKPAIAPPTPAPAPAPNHEPDTGRAAALFMRACINAALTVVLFLGAGLGLGFFIGLEIGLAQGIEQGIDQLQRLVSR